MKRGPAVGIIVLLATQNVTKDTIPTSISNNAVLRFCLKVFGWEANDKVLGTGAHKAGVDATMFTSEDKGIGYLRGEDVEPKIVRSVHGLDAVASEKVAHRARLARLSAGRLSGHAADEEMETEAEQVVLLDDVRTVFREADALHLPDIIARLALLRPALYGSLNPRTLGGQLRQAGVEVTSVYVAGKPPEQASAKGVKRSALEVSTTEVIGDIDQVDNGVERDNVVELNGRRQV